MRLFRFIVLLISLMYLNYGSHAQDVWSLQRCIEYARSHNIQIKQQVLQKRLSELQLRQSRLSQFPTVNAGADYGYNYGRSIDPTTNQFVGSQLSSAGLNMNAGITLFSWFQKRNTIAANQYADQAAREILENMEDNISLNIANAYLQILQTEEQEEVSVQQISLTQQQLDNTSKQVVAGALPESNEADLEAQLARDSATYITNKNNVTFAILQMKTLLNLDFRTTFIPEKPDLAKIPILNIAVLTPEEIYQSAVAKQPQILSDSLQVLSAEKQVAASKGALYPSLSFGAGLGTNYSSNYRRPVGETTIAIPPSPIGSVDVNGTNYTVNSLPQQITNPKFEQPKLSRQISDNLRENLGLSLNIPLFNGLQTRAQIEQSKINLENQRLVHEQDLLTLKQDIYQAYANAKASLENYVAAQKTLKSSQTAFYYAQQRYNVGLINSLDYVTSQNSLFQAQNDLISKHYDYIFKMKILEFYKNLNITL